MWHPCTSAEQKREVLANTADAEDPYRCLGCTTHGVLILGSGLTLKHDIVGAGYAIANASPLSIKCNLLAIRAHAPWWMAREQRHIMLAVAVDELIVATIPDISHIQNWSIAAPIKRYANKDM
ncbi:hypothetical protein Tdes44962_MAKER07755 [Teratosphaeria destructans]|uniref:Uncharacterized protein n=1 Tax=Teratosphaeria destructans TaxID=418781 RepID=A0A9W7SY66_9PEZI|nr:hypothetical protein Tdes44962_MAKER07755 [Teratosphaeria destructans]